MGICHRLSGVTVDLQRKLSSHDGGREKDSEEVAKMTGLIEDYAKKYAKEREIRACIETLIECTNMSEKDIIEKIIQKYNLTSDEAESYYVTCKAAVQDK